jgi:AraC family transcriptional regulator
MQTTLAAGTFIGRVSSRIETASFVFSRMSANVSARDMPRHSHDAGYFFFVISGVYATEARGATAACGPGSLIFNPSGTTHRDHFVDADGEFLAIGVSNEPALRMEAACPVSTLLPHAPLPVIQAISREIRHRDTSTALVLESSVMELIADSAGETATVRQTPRWILRARDRLREECTQNLTIGTLAADVGVHPVYLARVFRAYFKCSPGEYQRMCRIDRARHLLTTSTLCIADIAQRTGFYDHSQMTNAFVRAIGRRPTEYRRLFGWELQNAKTALNHKQ